MSVCMRVVCVCVHVHVCVQCVCMYMCVHVCVHVHHREEKFRTLGLILSTLGSVPSNVFTVDLGILNTFDGTDPKWIV